MRAALDSISFQFELFNFDKNEDEKEKGVEDELNQITSGFSDKSQEKMVILSYNEKGGEIISAKSRQGENISAKREEKMRTEKPIKVTPINEMVNETNGKDKSPNQQNSSTNRGSNTDLSQTYKMLKNGDKIYNKVKKRRSKTNKNKANNIEFTLTFDESNDKNSFNLLTKRIEPKKDVCCLFL